MTTNEARLDEAVGLMHDIRVDVASIKTKLDEHVKHQDERTRQRDVAQAGIVARLEALERFRWTIVGAAAVVGGLAGKVAGLL